MPAGLCFEANTIRVPVLHEGFSSQDLTAYFQALQNADLIYHLDDAVEEIIWHDPNITALEISTIVKNHWRIYNAKNIDEPWDHMPDLE